MKASSECPGSNTPANAHPMDTAAVCPHCRQQVHLEQGRFLDHFGLSGAFFAHVPDVFPSDADMTSVFVAWRKAGLGELKRMLKTINDRRAN
jgi:hypothetical protein